MTNLIDLALLFAGFAFAFFLPGFLIIEVFFKKIPKIAKIPLYGVVSVIVSTYFTYYASYILGFNRGTLVFVVSIFLFSFTTLLPKMKLSSAIDPRHLPGLVVCFLVFVAFFLSLYSAIFTPSETGFIMAANNWQDTAMHFSIIESLTQGNFPPEAPYFSGQPLSYYYFSDFHTAVLATIFGTFAPKIMVLDNALFVFIFALSLYALSYLVSKNTKFSILATLFAVFFGNVMFVNFIKDVFISGDPLALLARDGYSIDFSGIFQVTPIADYFMQNRPMMFALPAVTTAFFLTILGFSKKDASLLFLAGIIVAALSRFQFFGFASGVLIFFICIIFAFVQRTVSLRFILYYFLPIGIFLVLLFLEPGFGLFSRIFKENLAIGLWMQRPLDWYLKFIAANFGFALPLSFLVAPLFFAKEPLKKTVFFWPLYTVAILFFLVPFVTRFTIFDRDMYKFFYFLVIPLSILYSFFIFSILKVNKIFGRAVFIITFFVSIANAPLILSWSLLSKVEAYTNEEFEAGMWAREETPQKSVFITYPSVHNPVSDIGGRLRVLSYINWPHSHGFNTGEDNVWSRLSDTESLFTKGKDREVFAHIVAKYAIDYIYLGKEERANYPDAEAIFEGSDKARVVYRGKDMKIYEILD